MSVTTLNILRTQRKFQMENSPFSEEFQIVGGGFFNGIFDEAHEEPNKDGGNVTQKKLLPGIMVAEVPEGLIPRTTVIRREEWETGDKEYTLNFIGKDKEGIPLLWLF